MVGLIQKLLFDMMESSAGVDTAREIRCRTEVPQDKEFHINEVYDDEWRRIFAVNCDVLNATQEQTEGAYADFFYKDGLTRRPMWFKMAKNAREFCFVSRRFTTESPRASKIRPCDQPSTTSSMSKNAVTDLSFTAIRRIDFAVSTWRSLDASSTTTETTPSWRRSAARRTVPRIVRFMFVGRRS